MPQKIRFLSSAEREDLCVLSEALNVNPFSSVWDERTAAVLGDEFVGPLRAIDDGTRTASRDRQNLHAITRRIRLFADELRRRLAANAEADEADLRRYENLAVTLLHLTYRAGFARMVRDAFARGEAARHGPGWEQFETDFVHYLRFDLRRLPSDLNPAREWALLFQIERARAYLARFVAGASAGAVRLRAAVWESIFGRDLIRYSRGRDRFMSRVTTLVVGPSGSGKEVVATAIGFSRFIPFDPRARQFGHSFLDTFFPLNLSALPSTLIESELFGHVRGAFTGADRDHVGWFETCPDTGTVFLDEIGDVALSIQVKLLRVLESAMFSRVGDTVRRKFEGKVVAATNRDLAAEIAAGGFREDLYFRLCADVIRTPSLREQLAESPGSLGELLRFVGRRVAGEEADSLAEQAERWIRRDMDPEYAWPGNMRELEQCVRSVWLHGRYDPPARSQPPSSAGATLAAELDGVRIPLDELMRRYCAHAYRLLGSYRATGARLEVDWRTVRALVHGSESQR